VGVTWLVPAAWVGVALLAIPILIHFLARQQSRRVPFPSLRFLPATQLAALRRRVVSNWPLLLVRVLIVVAAVAAAAGPVVVSNARRQAWDQRIARAIVVVGRTEQLETTIAEAEQDGFRSERFADMRLPDALRAAADWLDAQPPAAREVVIVGDLREGQIEAVDLHAIPPHVAVRFLPHVGDDNGTSIELQGVGELTGEDVERFRVSVRPGVDGTRAEYQRDANVQLPLLQIVAAANDQSLADALLRAVWRAGVAVESTRQRESSGPRRHDIVIAFDGAAVPVTHAVDPDGGDALTEPGSEWAREILSHLPATRGEVADTRLVIQVPMSVRDERAAGIVARIVNLAYEHDYSDREPRRISAATLAAWSRPASGSPPDVLPADEGDRRWFWAAALMLLGAEHALRRRPRHG
jgi:hypothetical protein